MPNIRISILRVAFFVLFCAAVTSQTSAQNGEGTQTKHRLKKVRVNSVELHYLEVGKGIPVIFVHGGLDDYRMWEAQRNYWRSNLREWQSLTTSRDAFPPLSREEVKRIKSPALMISGGKTMNVLKSSSIVNFSHYLRMGSGW